MSEDRRADIPPKAGPIAQLVETIRAMRTAQAPWEVQVDATRTLLGKLTPFAKPGQESELALLLLNVAEVIDAIRAGPVALGAVGMPDTMQELERLFKGATDGT